jgi:hypothetical protein
VNTSGTTSTTPEQVTPDVWPSELELRDALMWAEDVMARCQIPFIVLGSAAYQIYHDEPLHVPKITIGVMEQHAVPEQTSLLKTVDPSIEMNMDGWTIATGSAKVVVQIMKKKHPTLLNPDIHWYWVEPFHIPNPFDVYWKGEHYDI